MERKTRIVLWHPKSMQTEIKSIVLENEIFTPLYG